MLKSHSIAQVLAVVVLSFGCLGLANAGGGKGYDQDNGRYHDNDDNGRYHDNDDNGRYHDNDDNGTARGMPKLTRVEVDLDSGQIFIHGRNFRPRRLQVTLAGEELTVDSATRELIVAWLPPGIVTGDYRLVVATGRHGERKQSSFDLTVGAAGAQGEPGPEGPAGPQGPIGMDGPQGPAGSQGPIGMDGPQGPAGPQGPIGMDGPQGPAGPQGETGPQGQVGATGPQGLPGPRGFTGPQGPRGFTGPAGPPGLSGYVRTSVDSACSNLARCTRTVSCPGGRRVLSGGVDNISGGTFGVDLIESYPLSDFSWTTVTENNEPFVSRTLRLWAVCAFTN